MEDPKRGRGRPAGTSYPKKLPLYESEEGLLLIQEMARRRGLSAAAFIRQLVREEARRLGLINGEEGAE